MLEVNIKRLREDAILPEYATSQAAGMDVHACIDKPIKLFSLERMAIPTGLAVELPEGYELQVRARSGLSSKHGITMVNGIGTVDADYRGEISALMINLGQDPYTIHPGDRIAQFVIAKFEKVAWQPVEALNETERGSGGFGSTGFDKVIGKD